jgi:hypothetical protein
MADATLCDVVHPRGYRCALPAGHAGNHRVRGDHHCHARGCGTPTRPEMLMCLRHWRMVPRELQRAVWAAYRVGQCGDKRPSSAWHAAADAAIDAVAKREGLSNAR